VNNVLAITGYADVKLAIDGKQPATGWSNITTEQSTASNVTARYTEHAGYSDVKQPTLTGSSNITTGTINIKRDCIGYTEHRRYTDVKVAIDKATPTPGQAISRQEQSMQRT
jgi:beta-galactosidase beta subunit